MDKRLTLLVLSLMVAVCMFAQDNATLSINEIKGQGDVYLYAESTSPTWEEALDNAKYLLGEEIETWVEKLDSKPADGYIAEARNHILSLKSMRGDHFRAFVYIRKSDIVPVTNVPQLAVVPVIEEQKTTSTEMNFPKEPAIPAFNPTEFEKEMMSVTDANNIGTFIKHLKSEDRINNYGKYKDMPTNTDCYLFVYNRDMEIPAYLHKQNGEYINLQSGKQDQITNYSGCGAWWFQLK